MSKRSGTHGKTVPQLARSMGAERRLAAREARDPQQQADLLAQRPGQSSRERRRLNALLAASQPAKTPATKPHRRARRKASAA